MEKLNFDTGLREFKVNGDGVLRFNPGDPNVYTRFLGAAERIGKVEETLVEKAAQLQEEDPGQSGAAVLQLMEDADREIKKILGWIFGESNDFDRIFGGVNLMAVATNGERVLTNFLAAIQPVMLEGLQKCAREQAGAVVAGVKPDRAAGGAK